jgi:hypothetical protein
MIPESRLIFTSLDIGRRSERTGLATNCAVGQPLADNALQRDVGTGQIIDPEAHAVVVSEIEFSGVAVQMMLGAMLIDADHSALEHAVEALDGVGVDVSVPNVFVAAMGGKFVGGEMLRKAVVLPGFVGHYMRGRMHVCLDDRQQVRSSGPADMEGHDAGAFRAPLNEGHDGVLVSVATTDHGAFLTPDEGLVDFDDPTLATERSVVNADHLHGFPDAMTEEPSGLHATAEGPVKLASADALLAAAHQMDGLQPEPERHMGRFKYGPHANGERLAAGIAFVEAGTGGLALQLAYPSGALTVEADRAIRPKLRFDVFERGALVVEMFDGQGGLHGGYLLDRNHSQEHWVCQV